MCRFLSNTGSSPCDTSLDVTYWHMRSLHRVAINVYRNQTSWVRFYRTSFRNELQRNHLEFNTQNVSVFRSGILIENAHDVIEAWGSFATVHSLPVPSQCSQTLLSTGHFTSYPIILIQPSRLLYTVYTSVFRAWSREEWATRNVTIMSGITIFYFLLTNHVVS